jgi:hypothetical protein
VRTRTAGAVLTALAVLATLGGYVAWRALGPKLPPLHLPTGTSCVVSADKASAPTVTGAVSLNAEQMANAATISAVGIRRAVPERAVVVALATALQESKLQNLAGGDRDSVGLFQQRPSQGWGTPEQIADPRYAANAFYTALQRVRGWQSMRVTDAAQAVQRSAHPDAYEKWADKAEVLARALVGDAQSAVACTVAEEPAERGTTAAAALTSGLRLDWGDHLRTAPSAELLGVAVAVGDTRAGWQYAHWLVAHAEQHGIKRVRYGSQEWTAKGGTWAQVAGPGTATAAQRVLAEVYADA